MSASSSNTSLNTQMMAAIKSGDKQTVTNLLALGVSPNFEIENEGTLLLLAVRSGKLEIADLLRKWGAEKIKVEDTSAVEKNGDALKYFMEKVKTSAMWDAALRSKPEMIKDAPKKEQLRRLQNAAVISDRIEKIYYAIELLEEFINSSTLDDALKNEIIKDKEQIQDMVTALNKKNGLMWQEYYKEIANIIDFSYEKLEKYENHHELKELYEKLQDLYHQIYFDDIYQLPFIMHELKIDKISDIQWESINRICFRGDSRDPQRIFRDGFSVREQKEQEVQSIPFVTKNSVIQFSSRFTTAALFPMTGSDSVTWVYVFKADKGFNVHKHSVTSFVKPESSTINIPKQDAHKMFVQELITDRIAGENIIAAVKIKRKPNKDYQEDFFTTTYREIGNYQILGYEFNRNCTVDPKEKKLAIEFIEKEIQANKVEQHIPSPTSGFSLNVSKRGLFSHEEASKADNQEVKDSTQLNLNKK